MDDKNVRHAAAPLHVASAAGSGHATTDTRVHTHTPHSIPAAHILTQASAHPHTPPHAGMAFSAAPARAAQSGAPAYRPGTGTPPPALDITLPQRIVSASFGALITNLVTMPLDVVKTRLQAAVPQDLSTPTLTRAAACCPFYNICRNSDATFLRAVCVHVDKTPPKPAPRLSAIATFSGIVRSEGVRALWRGLAPTLIMAAPSTALYFSAYDELKRQLQKYGDDDVRGRYAPLFAGIMGRVATVIVVSPLELLRTRAMYRAEAGGVLGILRREVHAGGVSALWRGLVPTLWRDVPFSGIYWLGYERVKEMVTEAWFGVPAHEPTLAHVPFSQAFAIAFAAGATSGAVAATVTTPFDVIKTRRQIQMMHAGAAANVPVSTVHLLQFIAKEEGIRGLFAGLSSRVAKVAPSCAIMIASYEIGKRFFSQIDEAALAVPAQVVE